MMENGTTRINVADLRARMGLSRAQMAEKLQVTPEYIRLLERGERVPGVHLELILGQIWYALDQAP